MNDAPNAPEREPEKQESAKDADLRIQSHPDTPLLVKKTKSKKKVFIWLSIALLAVATIAAVVFYFVIPTYFAPKVSKDDSGYSQATTFSSSKELIKDVNSDLKGAVVEISEANGFGGKTADGFGAYSVPAYKVGDRKYSNLPGASSGASFKGTSVDAADNYSALVRFFTQNKFKQLESGKDTTGINQWFTDDLKYVSYASYESSNLLCMIWHVDASPTSLKQHVTSVGCADKSSYESAAKELDQFYASYTKGESAPADKIVLGMPIGNSGADNYLNAVLYQEDPSQLDQQFQGLYYRTKDQKEWTYFTGSYGPISCKDYNTDVLKKAFKGFNCYDDVAKTYSTVV